MLRCIWAVRYCDCVNFYLQVLPSVSSRCHVYLLLCLVSVLYQYFQPSQECCLRLTFYYMPSVRAKKSLWQVAVKLPVLLRRRTSLTPVMLTYFKPWTWVRVENKAPEILSESVCHDLHWSDCLQLPLHWLMLLPFHQWKIVVPYYRWVLLQMLRYQQVLLLFLFSCSKTILGS